MVAGTFPTSCPVVNSINRLAGLRERSFCWSEVGPITSSMPENCCRLLPVPTCPWTYGPQLFSTLFPPHCDGATAADPGITGRPNAPFGVKPLRSTVAITRASEVEVVWQIRGASDDGGFGGFIAGGFGPGGVVGTTPPPPLLPDDPLLPPQPPTSPQKNEVMLPWPGHPSQAR